MLGHRRRCPLRLLRTTSPRSARSTTISRTPSPACWRATSASLASSPSSAASSSATSDMAPVLRQAIIASEDGDFEQHFGLSVSRIVITGCQGHRLRPALRRQHHHAAAGARPLPQRIHDQRRVRAIGLAARRAQAERDARVGAARAALHEGRDPHALRQPDQSRARRVRRRGGLADVLRQVRRRT